MNISASTLLGIPANAPYKNKSQLYSYSQVSNTSNHHHEIKSSLPLPCLHVMWMLRSIAKSISVTQIHQENFTIS